MNLTDLPVQIKTARKRVFEIETLLTSNEAAKVSLIKIRDLAKLECKKIVAADEDLSNDKKREIAYKEMLAKDPNWINSTTGIEELEKTNYVLNQEKTSLSIDIEFWKNTLKVAEIEAKNK